MSLNLDQKINELLACHLRHLEEGGLKTVGQLGGFKKELTSLIQEEIKNQTGG
jgi:hypothetical protein